MSGAHVVDVAAAAVVAGAASIVVQTVWLAGPAIVAGVLHMFVVKHDVLASLALPIDGWRSVRGRRVFGDNKTWRGVVVIIALGALLGALQGRFWGAAAAAQGFSVLGDVALLGDGGPRYDMQYALAHALFGLGYVLGELPNSFVKRQLEIRPGGRGRGAVGVVCFCVDHVDSVVVAFALGALVFPFGLAFVLPASALLSVVHVALTALLAAARVKRRL